MNVWFTSDTHFGHDMIIEYCDRPFKNVKEMDQKLIDNWNSVVKDGDTVFHLGDFSLYSGNPDKYLKRLNGNIVWVEGNHDKKSIILDMQIKYGGHIWHLAHNPRDCFGEYNMCGHVHKLWKIKREDGIVYVNVGVDLWGYKPISIQQILELLI